MTTEKTTKTNKTKKVISLILQTSFVSAFGIILSLVVGYLIIAWTGPTGTPPDNNVPAPINVGLSASANK